MLESIYFHLTACWFPIDRNVCSPTHSLSCDLRYDFDGFRRVIDSICYISVWIVRILLNAMFPIQELFNLIIQVAIPLMPHRIWYNELSKETFQNSVEVYPECDFTYGPIIKKIKLFWDLAWHNGSTHDNWVIWVL